MLPSGNIPGDLCFEVASRWQTSVGLQPAQRNDLEQLLRHRCAWTSLVLNFPKSKEAPKVK